MIGDLSTHLTATVPLTLAHTIAQHFAQEQLTPHKAQQVRMNTLAVYAVHFYLGCLGIETNLESSDCWQSVPRMLMDIADLEIQPWGKLECRPMKPGSQTVHIPPEVWERRIGYVAVAIDEDQKQATVLGFIPSPIAETVPVHEFQSLEQLLKQLERLQEPIRAAQSIIHLSNWLQHIYESGWQAIESLSIGEDRHLTYSVRAMGDSSIRAGKLLDLGIQLHHQAIALLIGLIPESEQKMAIRVQIRPAPDSGMVHLPADLTLSLLSFSGEKLQEVTTRSQDNFIQLKPFKCAAGKQFQIQVALNDLKVTENFVV